MTSANASKSMYMRENDLKEKVLSYCNSMPHTWAIKIWCGGYYQQAGLPDVFVICKGQFLGVELKASKGKPSAIQLQKLQTIEQAGGIAILLYPQDFGKFQEIIESLQAGGWPLLQVRYFKDIRQEWEGKLL